MGAFLARQPNGKLCRFSTTVDTVTDFNMTDEEYIEMCVNNAAKKAREDAIDTLKHYIQPFENVKEYFFPNNNTIEEFENLLKQMGDNDGLGEDRINALKNFIKDKDDL